MLTCGGAESHCHMWGNRESHGLLRNTQNNIAVPCFNVNGDDVTEVYFTKVVCAFLLAPSPTEDGSGHM